MILGMDHSTLSTVLEQIANANISLHNLATDPERGYE
jgi:hypothetical protein